MKKPASVLDTLTDEEMAAVVQRIIYLRTKVLKFSQKQFAEELQVSQSYISLLESGKKPLTKYAYEKILSNANVLPEWLLYGKSDQVLVDRTKDTDMAEQFRTWYDSLPIGEQSNIARAVKSIYAIMKNYPPGS